MEAELRPTPASGHILQLYARIYTLESRDSSGSAIYPVRLGKKAPVRVTIAVFKFFKFESSCKWTILFLSDYKSEF